MQRFLPLIRACWIENALRVAPCVLVALACLGSARGVELVDSAGFESPFTTGALGGQQGWVDIAGNASTATVQSDLAKSGQNALRVVRANSASANGYWAKRIVPAPSGRYVTIDWDMLIDPTGFPDAIGPFFGVNVFDDSTGAIAQVASLGVDATTGDVLTQETGTGFFVDTGADAPEVSETSDGWAHYRIELDFLLDVYNAYLNGQLVDTHAFIDEGVTLEIDRLSDADIVALPAAGDPDSLAAAGTAYFDNFIVSDGAAADYNDDGFVNAADYTVWRNNLGLSGFAIAGDGNGDGQVDGEDYSFWREAYGESNALPASGSILTVPEPLGAFTALAMLALASATFNRRRG